jgi:hypothetical protein
LVDLAQYRQGAESFFSAMDREYYLHFSGRQDAYDIEPIYDEHADLFSRPAVDDLRETAPRSLLEFAAQGYIGRQTREESAELARREAAMEVEVGGERFPFRASLVVQANEPDADRRAAIEDARNASIADSLEPIERELLERTRDLTHELGWPTMTAMCEELSGIDITALGEQTAAFLTATDRRYPEWVGPPLRHELGLGPDELRSSDLQAFFRGPALDEHFPADRLEPVLAETLAGMGIELDRQEGVTVDTVQRPKKSPRAFCSPVRVPDEVYLVIARMGGREDYAALFHEAGHTEHYAHMDRSLPVEDRYFGDNSVTEGFAYLFEHLVEDPEWLRRRLGVEDTGPVTAHARATKLLFIRRYCGKLAYELELHSEERPDAEMPERYARRLSGALQAPWSSATWLSDVDPFFYAARYLRAWALETRLRAELRERFGPAWFDTREAGALLIDIWRRGQGFDADELLQDLTGERLDFSTLAAEFDAS